MVGVSRGTWVIPVMKSLASMVVLCRRCWILSRIFLKFMQFVLADGCAVFVWVSVELLGACHLVLCFPGSFSMKLIQSLGKSLYANRWKIKKNMPSNLSFVISGN